MRKDWYRRSPKSDRPSITNKNQRGMKSNLSTRKGKQRKEKEMNPILERILR